MTAILFSGWLAVATGWRMATRRPSFFPELIDPGDWTVEEWDPNSGAAPCLAPFERRASVPAGHSKWAVEVRFHESLHAKYSRWDPNDAVALGITPDSVLAAEDARVNLKGALIRPHDSLRYGPQPNAFATVMQFTERRMAQLAVASIGYASSDEWFTNFASELAAVHRMAELPEWVRDHAANLWRTVRKVHRDAAYYVPPRTSTPAHTIELARGIDTFKDAPPQPPKGPTPDDAEGEYGDAPEEGDASDAKWGEMTIETPPLVRVHPAARRLARRTLPSDEGTEMKHFDRLVSGEVYGRPRRTAARDAILVDGSGSMHWDRDKLYRIVEKSPCGVLAVYCGSSGQGVLRIVARDGRMVAPELVKPRFSGNEVDGPALRWLAQQRGNKLWVSDQAVCTDGGADEEALLADCRNVMRRAGIKVCLTADPDAVIRALRGR